MPQAYAGLADAYVILNFYTGRHRKVSMSGPRPRAGEL